MGIWLSGQHAATVLRRRALGRRRMERVLEEIRRLAWLYGRSAEINQDSVLILEELNEKFGEKNLGFHAGIGHAYVDAANDMLELAEWLEGS